MKRKSKKRYAVAFECAFSARNADWPQQWPNDLSNLRRVLETDVVIVLVGS